MGTGQLGTEQGRALKGFRNVRNATYKDITLFSKKYILQQPGV